MVAIGDQFYDLHEVGKRKKKLMQIVAVDDDGMVEATEVAQLDLEYYVRYFYPRLQAKEDLGGIEWVYQQEASPQADLNDDDGIVIFSEPRGIDAVGV
jgi:hypothetical protein